MTRDRAAFLDKDGTLIENVPYNVAPDLIRLTPGAAEGLARLHERGYRLIVVSNQPGVALGYFPETALQAVEDRIRDILSEFGIPLEGFVYCPHHPDGIVAPYARACDCRKPAPGMIAGYASANGIDLARSWLVGDILDDVEAGHRAGCRSVLIDNGNETEWVLTPGREPYFIATDLLQAARAIATFDAGASLPDPDRVAVAGGIHGR